MTEFQSILLNKEKACPDSFGASPEVQEMDDFDRKGYILFQ